MNLVSRMGDEGVPSRIDRSYLSNMPGSAQTFLMSGMRSLGFIDADGKPTELLLDFVDSPQERENLIAGLLESRYTEPMKLGRNATQQQLEEAFRSYGITGSTLRKAVAFFLAAAKFAGVELSPHFRTPRAPQRPRKLRKRTTVDNGAGGGEEIADEDAVQRYVNLLLQKAEEDMNPQLLDRIERVIGVQTEETHLTPKEED